MYDSAKYSDSIIFLAAQTNNCCTRGSRQQLAKFSNIKLARNVS
jgi:hypothetical protein